MDPDASAPAVVEFPPFRLDRKEERLLRDGEAVELRPKTFAVLAHLVSKHGQLVRKEELLEAVWPDATVTPGTLNTSIREIRRALDDDAREPRFVETVHRRGFRFVAEVGPPRDGADGQSSGSRPSHVPVLVAPRVLHGRDEVLSQLDSWLTEARAGHGRAVFVTGEVGIGKTSVLRAFLARHAQAHVDDTLRVAWGQCTRQSGEAEAYGPVLDALDRLMRSHDEQSIHATMMRCAPSWMHQLPWLLTDDEAHSISARLGAVTPARMLRELAVAVEALTHEHALILVLEDLHWADAATIGLVEALAQRMETARFLLLCTFRPVDAAIADHPVAQLRRALLQREVCRDVALDHLSVDAVASYLEERFGWPEAPEGLASVLQDVTDGNPLFLVTLTSYLVQKGVVRRHGAEHQLDVPVASVAELASPSLNDILDHQLDALSAEERALLEVAAVASADGGSCSAQVLAAGVERSLEQVETLAGTLARRGQFIVERGLARWPDESLGRRFAFQHAAFKRILYDRVDPARRRRLHLSIARAIEAGHRTQLDEVAAELSVHFERGGDLSRVVDHLARAAAGAQRRFAHGEAIGHLERAIGMLSSTDEDESAERELGLRFALCQSAVVAAGWFSKLLEENLERCLVLSRAVGDERLEAFTLDRMVRRLSFHADYEGAARVLQELEQLAPRIDSPALSADVAHHRGILHFRSGRLAEAAEAFDQVQAIVVDPREAAKTIIVGPQVLAHLCAGLCAWLRGYPDDASARIEAGLALAERTQAPLSLLAGLGFAGELGRMTGRVDVVRQNVAAHHALLASSGIQFRAAIGCAAEAFLILESGDAMGAAAKIRAELPNLQSSLWGTLLFAMLAEALLESGDLAGGIAAAEDGIRHCEASHELVWLAELHRLRGRLHVRAGEKGQADAAFTRALSVAKMQGARSLELRAATSMAQALHERGESKEASKLLGALLDQFAQGHDTRDLRRARTLRDIA